MNPWIVTLIIIASSACVEIRSQHADYTATVLAPATSQYSSWNGWHCQVPVDVNGTRRVINYPYDLCAAQISVGHVVRVRKSVTTYDGRPGSEERWELIP